MIKKAVLPVAGLGTRFLPASKATPKEMLPIIDKPLVQYAVEEAISIGIKEIIFITSPEKNSIKRHFNKNEEIEKKLIKSGKGEIAKKLNPKIFSDITFYYINQETQNGLGDAILHAERIVNNEDFAVLLPDDLIFSEKSCLSQLLEIYDKHNSSVIAVNKVDEENIHKYGVIKPGDFLDNGIIIEDIIEKPSYKEAPSDIADVISQFLGQTEITRLLSPIANDLSEHLYYKCDTTMDKIRDYKDAIEYKRMYDNFQSPNDLVGTQFRCDTCLNKNRCRQCKKDLFEWKKNYSPPIYNYQPKNNPNEFDREMFLFDQQP